MALSAFERISAASEAMSDAIYAALDAIDAYGETAAAIAEEYGSGENANEKVVHRMRQFEKLAAAMTTTIEDDVLDDLNWATDRLFSVQLAEDGTFI